MAEVAAGTPQETGIVDIFNYIAGPLSAIAGVFFLLAGRTVMRDRYFGSKAAAEKTI